MGWINSIQRPLSLVGVLITVFALAACGNGDRDPAKPSAQAGPRDPSVEEILSKSAKEKMFKPHVLEEEGGDSYYGYGWVVWPTEEGRIVWHNGGNGWSFGVMARFPDQDRMVFWVSNHAYKCGEWYLENLQRRLTLGIAERVLDDR